MKDHRQLGRELELFSFSEESPGAVLWHPRGITLLHILKSYIRSLISDYQEISAPILVKSSLFQKSGHLGHYHENMFKLDKEDTYMKPMNCPNSALYYSLKTRSYRDLPMRISEFGILHRNELSGVVGGLFRLRQFVIDDGHIYLKEDQIRDEVARILATMEKVYTDFGFVPKFYFATRPEKAMGTEEQWKTAETSLVQAFEFLGKKNIDFKKGDGAFYGPKIDVHILDSQGRDWQLATVQLDFQIPEKMELEYIDADGGKKRPVIIHRALLGSLERFMGILLEHTQGDLPKWLAPTQTVIIPVAERHKEFALGVMEIARGAGERIMLDSRNDTVQSRVRDAKIMKIPNILVLGDKEMNSI